MTFYRKYRPQKIEELDLQKVRFVFQELASDLDKLPQAFLFAGPRGSGKTSAARIISKLVNCESPVKVTIEGKSYYEPCNKCDQCKAIESGQSMDVIEMDAASNRGIDDIRSLRENINLAPANANKKVYIMDEVHMLTTEAANAFLKTLEEPPKHVMFILATTNPEKLPETVVSRLNMIAFEKAGPEEISRQIARVSKEENLGVNSSEQTQ